MEYFKLYKLNNNQYDFLVIATSYVNPLSLYSEIREQIYMNTARILFDLTLVNGNNKNRYISCGFALSDNQFNSCDIVENVEENIKSITKNFFKNNEELINNSIIPQSLKFLIKSDML